MRAVSWRGSAAGRARIPGDREIQGPAATISLGDAADVDLAGLAAMPGPDGPGGEIFAQGRTADVMRPGPVLAALTGQAAGSLGRLTGNQVPGAMAAARRLAARAAWLELAAAAEFTRRREAQLEDATARGVPRGCRDGEFPDAELGMELVTSPGAARDTMDQAGPTDECNIGPPCRRHHRVKQAPGWELTQPEPGIFRWTTPAGRSYTTRPTVYDV